MNQRANVVFVLTVSAQVTTAERSYHLLLAVSLFNNLVDTLLKYAPNCYASVKKLSHKII